MLSTKKKFTAAVTLGFAGILVLAGCTMNAEPGTASDEPMAPETSESTDSSDSGVDTMDPAANLVGPGCEAYAEQVPDGDGSIMGMSQDPVAVAASNNPLLTTLVAAVSGQLNPDVDLVDTLNGDEFTVFAPVDDAFDKIDPATIEGLKTDAETLSSILTYHVVPGQIEPADIAGTHTTVQGTELEVTGEGEMWMVNDANVVCGGVQTANATVYLIDTVLMPPAQ